MAALERLGGHDFRHDFLFRSSCRNFIIGERYEKYAENHNEKRTIVTGRLKEENDTTFYRIIRVKCVPLTDSNISKTPSIDHALIKWQEDRRK